MNTLDLTWRGLSGKATAGLRHMEASRESLAHTEWKAGARSSKGHGSSRTQQGKLVTARVSVPHVTHLLECRRTVPRANQKLRRYLLKTAFSGNPTH